MALHIRTHNNLTAIIAPGKKLGPTQATGLRRNLSDLMNQGFTNLVIDLSQAEEIDSAGMAALVSSRKVAQRKNGDIKLVPPQASTARRIFDLTNFDRIFEMSETTDAAISAYGG